MVFRKHWLGWLNTLKNDKPHKENIFLSSVHFGPHESPGFRFWTEFLAWQRCVNTQLAEHDLTQPLFSILAVAAWLNSNKKTCTQQEIANLTKLDRMHVSQLTTKLVTKGFISRESDSGDKRVYNLLVTKKGYVRLETCIPLVEEIDKQLLLQ